MSLLDDAHTYLESEDYSVVKRALGLLVGTREAVGGREHVYVWVPTVEHALPNQALMADFGAAHKDQPQARKFLLVESMEGIRTEFRSDALKYFGVQIHPPARFFDTTFRDEEASSAASVTRRLRDRGDQRLRTRITQPYLDLTTGDEGDDLLPVLSKRLRAKGHTERPFHIVIGPAGIGKSFLFEALFSQLYNAFQTDKRSLISARRPLPLLPEYLDFASDPTLNAIVEAFLSTEFTRRLTPDNFVWKLTHAYGSWLIDGLDEVIARDTGLFDWLFDLATRPESPASPVVLICLRDSMFSTNAEFRDFVGEMDAFVTLYRLKPWSTEQTYAYAHRQLGDGAQGFTDLLKSAPTLSDLATLPYYSSLLVEQFRSGSVDDATADVNLLESALVGILEREEAKGLIDSRFISNNEIRELLEGVAAENMSRGFTGVDFNTLAEWVQLVTPEDIPAEDRERLAINLTQFALFSSGESGRIRFAQELLERYLLGCYLVDLFETNRTSFASRLGAVQIPFDFLTMRVFTDHVRRSNRLGEIVALAYETQHDTVAFRNLLQFAAAASEDGLVLRDLGFPVEQLDLSGIRFEALDLSGLSLRGCNLSDTEFVDCQLRDVQFAGAVLRNTRFAVASDALQGAEVGDLSTFYSLRADGAHLITDFAEARSWFAARTTTPVLSVEPCPAALQLRHLFGKYVYPTGEARRSWLDERAMVSGKRYINDVQALADSLVRHGFLVVNRGRFDRPGGDNYSAIVAYAKDMKLRSELRRVLNEVCDLKACDHVPRAQ